MVNRTVGEICSVLSGYAFDSKLFTENPQDKPLIRIRDVKRGYTNTYTKENYEEKYIVKNGDLIIGMDGEFNIAPWKSDNALLNQRVCKIWCSSNEVSKRYLLFFLPKALRDIERETSFVTVKHLSVKTINKIEIPLPPLETQKQIAQTLDTAAELLAMRKQQLAELDNLIKSTFYDMFGDPVANEKGWDIVSIVDVCTEIVDCVNKTAPIVEGISPYKMLRTTNIKKGKVNTQNVNYVDEKTFHKWTRRSVPRRGDVLLTREAPIGETGIIASDDNLFLGQRIMSYRVNVSIMNPLYLMYLMQSEYFQHQIVKLARGSTVKHLSVPECNLFEVYVPTRLLQTQFASIVTKIEEQKALVEKAIDETQYLFDSLMSEYFE